MNVDLLIIFADLSPFMAFKYLEAATVLFSLLSTVSSTVYGM